MKVDDDLVRCEPANCHDLEATKIMKIDEAVRRYVNDGDVVYVGGFVGNIPFAAVHEIIRQGKKGLTICKSGGEIVFDQLVGAGCVKKVIFGYLGNPAVGLCHAFRRAAEQGSIDVENYSNFAVVTMLLAGATGVPFLPIKSCLGSDILRYSERLKVIDCPYTHRKICLVPALNPDVGIVHAQRSDCYGNVQMWGSLGDAWEGLNASKKLIVSVEEIVDHEVVARDPNRTIIPAFRVDAIVEEPWGAHPACLQGYYDRDNDYYREYGEKTRSKEGFDQFMNEWVYNVRNRTEYLDKLGIEKLISIRAQNYYSFSVNYGY